MAERASLTYQPTDIVVSQGGGQGMSVVDAIRICIGLGFPLLLIGHVFSTRITYEWYWLAPEYSRVVAGLIASGSEGRQLALLAPGWLHG